MGRAVGNQADARHRNNDGAGLLARALIDALDADALEDLAELLAPYLKSSPDRLLDAAEKAAHLGLHRDTVVRMAREGRLSAEKIGREWRFPSGQPAPEQQSEVPRRSRDRRAGSRPSTSTARAASAAIRGAP